MRPESSNRHTEMPKPQLDRASSCGIDYYTDIELHNSTGVRVAFTERSGGVSVDEYRSLNLAAHVDDNPKAVDENRRRLLRALGIIDHYDRLVNPRQVHGDDILVVRSREEETTPAAQKGIDAVCCTTKDVPVLMCYADCVPVVIVASDGSFVVVHSGWRGSLAGIAGKAVGVLAEETGRSTRRMNAYIGPHIRSCCYTTGTEIMGSPR